MDGYAGRILIADLTDKTYEVRALDPDWARLFLGGDALGARYLYELMPANTPVFAPESVVGFVSGPTNNTKTFMGGRYSVVCKSPVTNGWNDASAGGNFGPFMRKAGFDAVFVKGISESPVYLLLDDGKVEFRDASHLWGKTVSETDAAIKAELHDTRISTALIGPGGEHLSNMAAVITDCHRAAARGGPGAVVGSKKLKGIAARGAQTVPVHDEDKIIAINKEWNDHMNGRGAVPVGKFRVTGTSSDYDSSVYLSDAGIKNWLGTPDDMTEEQIKNLTGASMDPKYKTGKNGCNACPVQCGAIYRLKNDKYDIQGSRPEYESLGAFGSMLLNGDSDTAVLCNWYCNEYGYDVLSFGGTLAWLMECYEKGILTKDELDGIEMTWGSSGAILAMTKKICDYEGVGVPLNRASRGAAAWFGKGRECLATASGIEIPMHGSRYNPGLARTFQYDPTPGRHVKGGLGVPYGHQPPEVKYSYSDTGARDRAGLEEWEFNNISGFCSFAGFLLGPGVKYRYADAVTGCSFTPEQWTKLGLRAFTIRDAFNLREGFRRKDFTISGRLVGKPPMEKGPLAGIAVDNELMADNFYAALGWDVETGVPSRAFLEEVGGLDCVIKDLYGEESEI
jgi:aldehyde:ferredoxin oxidoreductase